jgi:hypothetical protein
MKKGQHGQYYYQHADDVVLPVVPDQYADRHHGGDGREYYNRRSQGAPGEPFVLGYASFLQIPQSDITSSVVTAFGKTCRAMRFAAVV